MGPNALHRRSPSEFLEMMRDWPEDALRNVKAAIDRLLADRPSPDRQGLSSDDAFGGWDGPESAEEIIAAIRDARTPNPDREAL